MEECIPQLLFQEILPLPILHEGFTNSGRMESIRHEANIIVFLAMRFTDFSAGLYGEKRN